MKRQPITPEMKLDALLYRHCITCGICGAELFPNHKIEWDHVHALVHGGQHVFTNIRPVHAECHKGKTARDIAANAKVKRILADKPSKRPMKSSASPFPGSRASGLKKHMDGSVSRR